MKNLSNFQIGLIAVFVAAAIIGTAIFAFGRFGGEATTVGRVVIWGTVDGRIMADLIQYAGAQTEVDMSAVSYVQKDAATFDQELVNALAAGNGPDLFLLAQDDIITHYNKIVLIPYETYSERLFKDTFIEEGELYLFSSGIAGLPFLVDPLVMYWNRDILAAEGIAEPPENWSEFFVLSPRLSRQTENRSITRSTVALGEFSNVSHAKEILSTLILQAGNSIVVLSNGSLNAVLSDRPDGVTVAPAESALRFYTEFSNPVKSVYSWNRALPPSRQAFLAGDLVFYFGFASELSGLREANPNLNFDVAMLPQVDDPDKRVTFGRMHALAITRQSANGQGALTTAQLLTSAPAIAFASGRTVLPPVRRDLLRDEPGDQYLSIFYRSALITSAWLDPNARETREIFQDMIESVTSGRERLSGAISTAQARLRNLIP